MIGNKIRRFVVLGVVLTVVVFSVSGMPGQGNGKITVCKAGCDFATVSDAVIAADDNSLIAVAEGLFSTESITITKNLTVRGLGPDVTVVRNKNPMNSFVQVDGEVPIQVVFENLTLDTHCNPPTQNCSGDGIIVSRQASLALNMVRVANHAGIGVSVRDAAQFSLDSSSILGNGAGLVIADTAQVAVSFSSIDGNGAGVELDGTDTARLDFSNSSISNNGSGLIVVAGNDDKFQVSVDLFNAQIGNNGGHGFEGGGSVSIRSSSLLFNGGSGVVFSGSGTLLLFQNRIYLNTESGVELNCEVSLACASLSENEIFFNGLWGLKADPVMILECRNNFFHDNNVADFVSDDLAQRCS